MTGHPLSDGYGQSISASPPYMAGHSDPAAPAPLRCKQPISRDKRDVHGVLVQGWRLVRKGGVVNFGRDRFRNERLHAFCGQYVLCEIKNSNENYVKCFPYGIEFRDDENGVLILYPI